MRALGGGLSGAAAMVLQVLLLMVLISPFFCFHCLNQLPGLSSFQPLRTIMNYQYRFGTSFTTATKTLYQDGGFGRYYQGLGAALVQGKSFHRIPLAVIVFDRTCRAGFEIWRHGRKCWNFGFAPIKFVLEELTFAYQDHLRFIMVRPSENLYIVWELIWRASSAAAFRMILTPVDTLKTTLQVQGARGTTVLRKRIKSNGIGSLWWGAFATAAATFVGHYPWFATYNFLSENFAEPPKHPLIVWLLRLAFIGFVASLVSDSVSNSLRVVKTYRQVNDIKVSYGESVPCYAFDD